MPARIAVRQSGETLTERSRVLAAALAEAEWLGLGRPPDVDHQLLDLFELLARHTRAVSLRELADRHRRAYAAARGRYGVLAVIEGDQVMIAPVSGDHLAGELLSLLSPLPSGPGRTVSLPSSAFQAAMQAQSSTGDSAETRRILRQAGVHDKDADRVLTISREAIGSGSIGVHKRERERVKLIGSLSYIDTRHGRYALVERNDTSGRSYTNLMPVDIGGLRQRLQERLGTDAP